MRLPVMSASVLNRRAGLWTPNQTVVPATSYLPGLTATNIADVLDSAGVGFAARIREALRVFEKGMPGYAGQEAVLIGVESRTSAPVRVPRDGNTLTSPDLGRLYPAGEGAGYAGGIVSAALDGMNVARAIVRALGTSVSETVAHAV